MTRETMTDEEIEAIEKRARTTAAQYRKDLEDPCDVGYCLDVDLPRLVKALRAERQRVRDLREEMIRAHAPGVSVIAVDPRGISDMGAR